MRPIPLLARTGLPLFQKGTEGDFTLTRLREQWRNLPRPFLGKGRRET